MGGLPYEDDDEEEDVEEEAPPPDVYELMEEGLPLFQAEDDDGEGYFPRRHHIDDWEELL